MWKKRSCLHKSQRRPDDRIRKNNAFLFCLSQVLSFQETLTAYKSVYFIATIVPISLIILGKIIKPARPARTKARKEEWDAFAILDSEVLGLNFTNHYCASSRHIALSCYPQTCFVFYSWNCVACPCLDYWSCKHGHVLISVNKGLQAFY